MPKNRDDDFFETREDWSRRKHMILEYYLPPATAKLRSASPDGRVVILDGFAGRGHYEDGMPGSPVQMGQLADIVQSWQHPVNLRIFNIEAKPENHAELEARTQNWVQKGIITNYNTLFNRALPAVLNEAASSPLFAFLDPFSSAHLPFDDIRPLLKRSAITELLIVFHTPAVRRIISQVSSLNTDEKTKAGSARQLSAIFGSNSWEKFRDQLPTLDEVVRCFVAELAIHCRLPGKKLFICDTPIEAWYGINLKYHIIFVTRSLHGVRLINDAFAKEKRDVHSQTVEIVGMASLFEEYADPMDARQRPMNVRNAVLEAARSDLERLWSYEDLFLAMVTQNFGQHLETEYKHAIRELLNAKDIPRLVGIEGQKRLDGKWKVMDGLMLRFEQ